MGAIKAHKTAVDKTGKWDGPKAVAAAPNEAKTLRYMHAWVNPKADKTKKSAYKFPHHEPGTDTPAVLAGVNNALARLSQAKIPAGDKAGVEAHLRKHRKDAGVSEAMSEAEIAEAVRHIKDVDDLKRTEADTLSEAIQMQERANLGNWLESRIHLRFTETADNLFGDGYVTRDERIMLSAAIGEALDAFRRKLEADAAHLYQRRPFEGPPETGTADLAAAEGHPHHGDPPARGKGQFPLASQTASGVVLREASLGGEYTPLVEKAIRRDGTIPVKIIQPGWGSSGYYPAEVLERDGPKIFTKGTKMYWNHPTPTEEAERPERDLNDLAAELATDARWLPDGEAGPGLYADAKVFEAYKAAVDDLAGHIGVSILAMGRATEGEMEGKRGAIITDLTAGRSIDFVTEPGAGGQIIELFEAARTVRAGKKPDASASNHNEEADMDELQKMQEANAELQKKLGEAEAENARLHEALALREASDLAGKALAEIELPDATRKRLIETLAKGAPIKDGALDKEKFNEAIGKAVKAEVAYLTEVAGLGKITGMGGDDQDDDEAEAQQATETLERAFQGLGLGESAAKIAAKGRG